jgi:hypothetical protein
MKQAKLALTAVALFAVIGGALAFKANRNLKKFYAFTTVRVGNTITGACTIETPLSYTTVAQGGSILSYSALPVTSVTTCQARVVPNA